VKSQSTHYLELLERRLALLDSLSKALADSRGDFISMDLEGVERSLSDQLRFCTQIRSLDSEITTAQIRCAERAGVRPCTDAIAWQGTSEDDMVEIERIRATMGRLATAQVELKRLNDAHQAMLRRSRHTVQILMNLFKSYAPTYGGSGLPAGGTIYEERV
jgi:hypothetical protein